MQKNGYQPGFSASIVAVGSTLASLIPPSGILAIYAIIVEESVGKLLVAGFIPGILSAASIIIRVKLNNPAWALKWSTTHGLNGGDPCKEWQVCYWSLPLWWGAFTAAG